MSPIAHAIIEILAEGALILLCFKFYFGKKRNLLSIIKEEEYE